MFSSEDGGSCFPSQLIEMVELMRATILLSFGFLDGEQSANIEELGTLLPLERPILNVREGKQN